jgi:predicted regulator of Ras-like GTPase activity (Roadblock/LC7/MglB family)
MPYQALLDELVKRAEGAQAALLLASDGEVVVQAGQSDDRQRLIGVYQGLALAAVRRLLDRYQAGSPGLVVSRYARGRVILRPLSDGYYLVVSLAPDARLAVALHRSAETSERLRAEL